MDTANRLRHISDAAASASRRAAEAGLRLVEIERRLTALRTGETDALVDRTLQARRAADQAKARSEESRTRARRAHEAAVSSYNDAARAHDAAALAHRRLADISVGDASAHQQRSDDHLRLAAADRVAGLAELNRLLQAAG